MRIIREINDYKTKNIDHKLLGTELKIGQIYEIEVVLIHKNNL